MKLIDIKTRVRQIVGDVGANQFSDATLVGWINDGIRECAVVNQLLQKRATSTLTVGTTDYTLPTDILKLYTIVVSGSRIDVLSLAQWQKQNYDPSETGLPVMAYVWAGKYTVWPKPDQAYTVEIDYIYDPTDLVDVTDDNNLPPIPVTYHNRIVDYCIAQVALQDDNEALYSLKMEEFRTGVKSLEAETIQQEDFYPSVSLSPRDMGDGAMDWVEW